jgi:hypothetical protein
MLPQPCVRTIAGTGPLLAGRVRAPVTVTAVPSATGGMKGVHKWPGKVRLSNSTSSLRAGVMVGVGVSVADGRTQAVSKVNDMSGKRREQVREMGFINIAYPVSKQPYRVCYVSRPNPVHN